MGFSTLKFVTDVIGIDEKDKEIFGCGGNVSKDRVVLAEESAGAS